MQTQTSPRTVACAIALLATLFVSGSAQRLIKTTNLEVGKPSSVYVATPASGPWLAKYPFDPQTFGSSRGYCPISSDDPKIVLCALTLDKETLRLAAAVDKIVAQHKGLEWSIFQIADEKGAQRGGYTAPEVMQRIAELQKLATKNKITHLSLTLSATPAPQFSTRIGMKGGNNLLIAYLNPDADPKTRPLVKWMTQADSTKLTQQSAQEIVTALEKAVSTP